MDGEVTNFTRLRMTTEPLRPIAGAGIVVFREDEVLLIKRGKPPYRGQWSLPGGKIEYGETAAEPPCANWPKRPAPRPAFSA